MITPADAVALIEGAGHVAGPEHEVVLLVLREADRPLDAQAVWLRSNGGARRFARSIIARTLRLLEDIGAVTAHRRGARDVFSLAVEAPPAAPPSRRRLASQDEREAFAALEAFAARQGRVVNETRAAVFDVLAAAGQAMDTDAVWNAVSERGVGASYSTVTRSLRLLEELGAVEVSARQGSRRLFRLRTVPRVVSLVMPHEAQVCEVPADALLATIERFLADRNLELAAGICFNVRPAGGV